MFSINDIVDALIRAICTKGFGLALVPPFAEVQANHNSLTATVAPVCRPSARDSQLRPSGVMEL
jgi:hypothetical protein